MEEGLYGIRFTTGELQGSGVLLLEGGRLRGGDSRMYYVGRYSVNGTMFSADLHVRKHTEMPRLKTLFDTDAFSLSMHGNFGKEPAELIAVAPSRPGIELRATLFKLEEDVPPA